MENEIKLFEHNQKAYDALLAMLRERDRASSTTPTNSLRSTANRRKSISEEAASAEFEKRGEEHGRRET